MNNDPKVQEARDLYAEGQDYLTVSCLKCRYTPKYYDAIPVFKLSAERFHGLQYWNDEVKARRELIVCFKEIRSYWEEATEYEKLSKILLYQLNKPSEAFDALSFANVAFVLGRRFEDSVKVLTKAARDFKEQNYHEYCVKCLKIVLNLIIQYFHVLVLGKKNPHDYLYVSLDNYFDTLFIDEKYDDIYKTIEQIIRTIDHDEDDKSYLVHFYAIALIAAITQKNNDLIEKYLKKGRDIQNTLNDNDQVLNMIETIYQMIISNDDNEKQFNSILSELSYAFPTSIVNSFKKEGSISQKTCINEEEEELFNFK